jgi:hypothetical protein
MKLFSTDQKHLLKGARRPMDQKAEELINDCMSLQHEIGLLTPIILFLSPSFNTEKMLKPKISGAGRSKIRDKLEQFNGAAKIKTEYTLKIKELEDRLAELAELLEEDEFETGKFRSRLSEDQFDWLVSHKKEIKKHLGGIDLGQRDNQ